MKTGLYITLLCVAPPHSNCAPEVGFISLTLQKWKLRLRGILQGSCSHTSGMETWLLSASLHPWRRWADPQWVYLVHGETADAGYLREFPRVQFRITTSWTTGTIFFLPWKMNGTYHACQNILKGSIFFFFARTIIKSVGMWVFPFLLSPLSDTLPSHPTGSFPFSMCWDVETGAKEGG